MIDWGIVIQLVSMACVAIGIYVAIKSDLVRTHEKIIATNARVDVVAKETDKAHDRIDEWYRRETRG
jgi:Ca2+/H+ antiporter